MLEQNTLGEAPYLDIDNISNHIIALIFSVSIFAFFIV